MATTSTTLAGLQDEIRAMTSLKFLANTNLLETVMHKDLQGTGYGTAEFTKYNQLTPMTSSVAEGVTVPAETSISAVAISVTPAEYPLWVFLPDKAIQGSQNDIVDEISRKLANALQASIEYNITQNYSTFSSSVGGDTSGSALTTDEFYEAQTIILEAGGDPGEMNAVLNNRQWSDGTYGLQADLVHTATQANPLSEEALTQGFISDLAGVKVMQSTRVPKANSVASGAMYTREAIGLATDGIVNIEFQRDAKRRGWDIVATGRFASAIVNGDYGVTVATGTGE